MRNNTPLESFMGFMNLPKNSQNLAENSQNPEFKAQETEELVITDKNELKQCLEAFGEPLDILTAKEA